MTIGDNMKILLVRHGQTDANFLNYVQGITDNPLNEVGIKQAHEVGAFLKSLNYPFDVAVSSPLKRAFETGKIIVSYFNYTKDIIKDDHFMERNFGPFEQKPIKEVVPLIYDPLYQKDGYEDDKALISRVKKGLDKLYKQYRGKNVILFAHSHTIKAFLILADSNTYNFKTFLQNCSSHELSYDGKTLNVVKFNLTT